jgi:hypothetical protein
MIWSIHQPGLYLMKCFSILPPEYMAEGVDEGDACDMDNPPPRTEETYLPRKTFLFHIMLLSRGSM